MRLTKLRRSLWLAASASIGLASFAHAADISAVYTGGPVGSWSVATHWSPNGSPNNAGATTYLVFIDNGVAGDVTVFLDTSPTIKSLNISAGDTLRIRNLFNLTVTDGGTGSIVNAGTLFINSTSGNTTVTNGGTSLTFTGGGTVTMTLLARLLNGTIVNTDNRIQGAGNVGVNTTALVNQVNGIIDANVSGGVLIVDPSASGMINAGSIRASNGGTLSVLAATYTNTGSFLAADTSEVQFGASSIINGGTVTTSGSGVSRIVGAATFSGVANSGSVIINNGFNLNVSGTINNQGSILLNSTGTATTLNILGGGTTSFTGGGTVTMSQASLIQGSGVFENLNHTVRGAGTFLNTGVVNSGTIIASGGTLTFDPINSFHMFNNKHIQAESGGRALFTGSGGGTFANSGSISALSGGTVSFTASSVITGGAITAAGTGIIETVTNQSATYENVQFGGSFINQTGASSFFRGSIGNSGTMTINANSEWDVSGGTVTLTGGGRIDLTATNARILGVGTLDNVDNTVRGFGQLGVNGISIRNAGTISASGGTLTIDPINSGGFMNSKVLQAESGGRLIFTGANGGDLTNTGTISALAGGTVSFTSAVTVTGGTIETLAGGVTDTIGTSAMTFDSVTFVGTFATGTPSTTVLRNGANNFGTITIPATGTLQISSGTTTLTGGGYVNLLAADSRFVGSGTLDNINNTIRGFGELGANAISIRNAGIISASGGTLTIDPINSGGYTGTGTLIVENSATMVISGANGGTIDHGGGHTFIHAGGTLTTSNNPTFSAGDVILNGLLNHPSGTLTTGGMSGTGTFTQTINTATVMRHFRIGTLNLGAGSITITAGGGTLGTSVVNSGSITIAASSKIDLTDHDLVVEYTGATPFTAFRNMILTGRNNGAWTGNALTSSAAAATVASPAVKDTALAIGEASALGPTVTVFGGVNIDQTAVLIGYRYLGDANMDGVVNNGDFTKLSSNFNQAGKFWTDGDFNYDGKVNALDFNGLAGNFGAPALSSPPVDLGTLVPEPGGIGLLYLFTRPLKRARRRQK